MGKTGKIAGCDAITDGVCVNTGDAGLLSHGVTAFCPTVITSAPTTYKQVLPHLGRFEGGAHGAANVGVHVEGPFINGRKKGHGTHSP